MSSDETRDHEITGVGQLIGTSSYPTCGVSGTCATLGGATSYADTDSRPVPHSEGRAVVVLGAYSRSGRWRVNRLIRPSHPFLATSGKTSRLIAQQASRPVVIPRTAVDTPEQSSTEGWSALNYDTFAPEVFERTWQEIADACERGLRSPGYPASERPLLYDLLGAARECARPGAGQHLELASQRRAA